MLDPRISGRCGQPTHSDRGAGLHLEGRRIPALLQLPRSRSLPALGAGVEVPRTPLQATGPPPPRGSPTDLPQHWLQGWVAKTRSAASTPADFIGTFVGNNRTAVVSTPLRPELLTRLVPERQQGRTACLARLWQQHGTSTRACFPGWLSHWKKETHQFPFAAASDRGCYRS